MSRYTVTPSKNMTLGQLKKIKQDNYVGANGTDYNAEEVELRIIEIETKQAMELSANFKKHENARAKYMQTNDKLAARAAQVIELKPKKISFTLTTSYGEAV